MAQETYQMPFDEDEVEAAAPPKAEELASIAELIARLRAARITVEEKTAALKTATDALAAIEEVDLPNALVAARTKKFTGEDGVTVELKDAIHAGIKVENAAAAYTWLRENGHGDLIKRVIQVAFDRGQEAQADALLVAIDAIEHKSVDDKTSVHAGTLTAFVKEQLSTGNAVDEPLLGVYRRRYCEVKEPKAKKKF